MIVDNHRHLSGSIPLVTLCELLGDRFPMEYVSSKYTYIDDTRRCFNSFLEKFDILGNILWSEDNIDKVVKSVIASIRKEGVNYCDIHYSVNKYARLFGNDFKKASEFIASRIAFWSDKYQIQCHSILTVNWSHDLNPDVFKFESDLVDGIGAAGDEYKFKFSVLKNIFDYWDDSKKKMVHAGEIRSDYASHIINDLGVDRIQHATLFSDDHYKMIADRGIFIDISITSNLYTGVVPRLIYHPVKRMIKHGCKVSVSTDDPVVFTTNIRRELQLLNMLGIKHKSLNIIPEDYKYKTNLK